MILNQPKVPYRFLYRTSRKPFCLQEKVYSKLSTNFWIKKNLLDHFRVFGITLILSIGFQFFEIDHLCASDDDFQFVWPEHLHKSKVYFDEFGVDNFVEASFEGSELFLDAAVQEVLTDSVNVFPFVLLAQFHFVSVGNQIYRNRFSVILDVQSEIQFQRVQWLMWIQNLLQAVVILWFDLIEFLQVSMERKRMGQIFLSIFLFLQTQKPTIKHLWESHIQMNGVIDSDTKQHSHKLEYDGSFERERVKPIDSRVVFGDEHVEVALEDLLHQNMEILILNSSLVSSLFPNELYFQRVLEIGVDHSQLLDWFFEDVVSVDFKVEEGQTFHTEITVHIKNEISI